MEGLKDGVRFCDLDEQEKEAFRKDFEETENDIEATDLLYEHYFDGYAQFQRCKQILDTSSYLLSHAERFVEVRENVNQILALIREHIKADEDDC